MQKLVVLFSLLLSFAIPAIASGVSVIPSELTGWPWYQSTILAGIGQPKIDRGIEFPLAVPGTAKNLPVRLWKMQGSRGLILLLPGTGGGPASPLAAVLAETASTLGYDSLILANPFSPEFQASFSRDGIIGLPQKDGADLHRMLEAGLQLYEQKFGRPEHLVLMGTSLGAYYAVLEASRKNALPFDKVIALNPPASLSYGMKKLDEMIRLTVDSKEEVPDLNFELGWAYVQAQEGITEAALEGIKMFLPEEEGKARKVIGASFQSSLKAIARGLFSSMPEVFGAVSQREADGTFRNLTFAGFTRFSETALDARRERVGSIPALMEKANLGALLALAPAPERIQVITAKDDFLLSGSDLKNLDRILGHRLHVFEGGGHCGNYWTPSFKKVLAEILK